MGKLKDKAVEDKHELTEREFNLLQILNLALQFSTLKDKAISGVLYTICNSRLGYPEAVNLVFEVDLDDEKRIMKVTEVSTEDLIAEQKRLEGLPE